MYFISEEQSAAMVTHDLAFEAAREALLAAAEDAAAIFPAVLGHGSSAANRFSVKAAATHDLAGLKVGSYWPGNGDLGLPRHNSLILLFDQDQGRIAWAIEAGQVNAYRTAAADAVAVNLLARPDAAVLAVFGAGHQAKHECLAIARVRSICQVLVVARDPDRAAAFAADLQMEGLTASVSGAQAACERADIIVTATPSRTPLFEAEWVRPGAHLSAMGADGPGKQELPPALLTRARLFCDLPRQSVVMGEFQHFGGEVSDVTAIGAVLAGRSAGRVDAGDITIFDSSGIALQDLYIARRLVARIAPDAPILAPVSMAGN